MDAEKLQFIAKDYGIPWDAKILVLNSAEKKLFCICKGRIRIRLKDRCVITPEFQAALPIIKNQFYKYAGPPITDRVRRDHPSRRLIHNARVLIEGRPRLIDSVVIQATGSHVLDSEKSAVVFIQPESLRRLWIRLPRRGVGF